MSNEESERITTSQDVISRLHDKIDEQHARIAELEAQIAAVGAGGVQALSAAPVEQEEAAQRLRKTLDIDPGDVNDPLHPRYIAGFKSGHAAGRRRAAPAASPTPPAEKPIGEVVVTKTRDGQIVSVTRQDDEGRILSVIATSDPEEQSQPRYSHLHDADAVHGKQLSVYSKPPAEQQATKETSGGFHVWRDISTAHKDGSRFVAIGYNYGLYSEGRHICVAQWFRGCWMEASDWNETSELKYLTHWMPLPSPPDDVAAPAEQQAAPKAAPGEPSYSEKWDAELGRTAMRFVDRAGDVHPGIDDAETICAEFYKAMSEVIERMPHVQRMTPRKAAPVKACVCGEPQASGTVHRVDGPCYVAAPKAAPGEQNAVSAEWLEQAYREGWAACRDAETIGEEAEDWAFGNSTANSRMIDAQQAAPRQEAQEPTFAEVAHRTAIAEAIYQQVRVEFDYKLGPWTALDADEQQRIVDSICGLYTAPQPAPAELERLRERIARMGLDVDRAMRGHVNEQSPLGTTRLAAIAALAKPAPAPLSDDTKDAARYRWLRNKSTVLHGTTWLGSATAYQRDVDFLRHLEVLAQDQREHIKDIEAKLVRALSEADQLRAALVQAAQTVWEVGQSMRAAIPADCSELLGRDMCGHINLMAAHGDPDYLLANGKSVRHIDLRSDKPRKKRASTS